MKIRLTELRRIIRSVVREAQAPTVSSQLSPHEQELNAKFPNRANPNDKSVKHTSMANEPGRVKAKQVAAILSKKGLTADAENKKKVTQNLLPFIAKMDPQEMFAADPDDIAVNFAQQVLGVHGS